MFTQCKVQWKRQMTDHQKASVYHVATACIRKSFCYVRESPKILFPNIWKQYLQLNDKYIPQYCQPERSEGWFVIIFVSQNNVMLVVLCTEIILFHMGFAFLHQVENAKKFDYFHDCCSDFSLNANCFKGQNNDSCQVETKTTSFLPSESLNCKK